MYNHPVLKTVVNAVIMSISHKITCHGVHDKEEGLGLGHFYVVAALYTVLRIFTLVVF